MAQYSTSAHGSSNPSVAHDAMFFVDSQNRKKVDFNNTSLSRLVTKPMENHACGSACATEILNGINNWKNQGGGTVGVASSFRVEFSENSNFSNATPVNNANSPATLSGLSEGKTYHVRVVAINSSSSTNSVPMNFNTLSMSSGGGSSPIDYNINLRVGDRRYVDSVLRDIFNLNSDSNGGSSIRQQIYENPVFGGGCDKYSEVTISGYTIENPQERCFTGMWVSDLVNFNPMRAASMSKTCNTIVNNTTARNAAFQKIFGSTTAGAITDETFMNKAYQLFYPEELPTSEIRTALIALGNTSSSNTDKWRNVLYGLCVSPEWQTLY